MEAPKVEPPAYFVQSAVVRVHDGPTYNGNLVRLADGTPSAFIWEGRKLDVPTECTATTETGTYHLPHGLINPRRLPADLQA